MVQGYILLTCAYDGECILQINELDLILKDRNSTEKEIIGLWVFDIEKEIVETFSTDAYLVESVGDFS